MVGFNLEDKIKIERAKQKIKSGSKKVGRGISIGAKATGKAITRGSSKSFLKSPTSRQVGRKSRKDPFAPIQTDPFNERMEDVKQRKEKRMNFL